MLAPKEVSYIIFRKIFIKSKNDAILFIEILKKKKHNFFMLTIDSIETYFVDQYYIIKLV